MEPVQVLDYKSEIEATYGKDQPEYTPLPVLRTERAVLSRWRLSDDEKAHIANGGDLFICVLNFGQSLQPICPIASTPDRAVEIMVELGG